MPTTSPGHRAIQIAVKDQVHADLRREAFERDTTVSHILRRLITDHLDGRTTGDVELRQAYEAGRRAERERIVAAIQRSAPGLPTKPPSFC